MPRWRLVLATGMILLSMGDPSRAQPPARGPEVHAADAEPDTPAGKMLARVLKLFAGDDQAIADADLSDAFRKQVPIEKLRQVAAQIRAGSGAMALDGIDDGATDRALTARVTGAKNDAPMRILLSLDEQNHIVGLLVQPGIDRRVPRMTSWDDLKARIAPAAEKTSCTVVELVEARDAPAPDGPDRRATRKAYTQEFRFVDNSTDELAIGSTFKLWVLGALAQAVESGDASWDQKLAIRKELKSLPSGVMQNEPDGREFTLRQFAEKMISISDNTAADHLIAKLGRDRCERFMSAACPLHPELNRPFLTTHDLFALKLSGSDALPKRYLQAGIDARRELLSPSGDVAKAAPAVALAVAWKAPRFIDSLEWFAGGRDLADTMALLEDLSRRPGLEPVRAILALNPGVPIDRKVWSYAGYKGGSEPGVLSLTWLLERRDGRRFVLTLTFNDTRKMIDEPLCIGLAQRAMEFLGACDVKAAADGQDGQAPIPAKVEPGK